MNPDTGEIHQGTPDELKAIEKEKGIQMVPIPEDIKSALENMSPHQRQMWARQHRPTLDQLVEAGAELTAVQKSALEKRERRRQKALARR